MHQICDWAKYHNWHSSKSIWVTRLLFCQNDSLMGGIILAKGQLDHSYTFWTMPIMIFSPVANLMHHPLECAGQNLFRKSVLISLIQNYWMNWVHLDCLMSICHFKLVISQLIWYHGYFIPFWLSYWVSGFFSFLSRDFTANKVWNTVLPIFAYWF